jgi:DNA-binding response OmpR family regulator
MKKTVLLIEDNPVITAIYRNRLTAEGFDVKTASDSETGFQVLRKSRMDAVLLDLMLPKLSGIDFLKKIRGQPKFRALPVVVFSSASGTDLLDEGCKAGATHYLSKCNCPPKQVADVIRSALSSAEAPGAVVFPAVQAGTGNPGAASAPARNKRTSVPTLETSSKKPTKTWELPEIEVPPARSILMLEDNDGMAELLKIFLEAQSFQVTRVTGGGDGLRQIMQRDFDAILCDMVMPNMAGDLFYLAVQRTKPHLCKRFIFMTGHHSDKKWDRFIEKVQCVMLWKPFQLASLLGAINTLIEQKPVSKAVVAV